MNQVKRKKRKAHVEERDCVACGCCVKVCPMSAIQIFHGVMAVAESGKMCWLRKVCKSVSGNRLFQFRRRQRKRVGMIICGLLL